MEKNQTSMFNKGQVQQLKGLLDEQTVHLKSYVKEQMMETLLEYSNTFLIPQLDDLRQELKKDMVELRNDLRIEFKSDIGRLKCEIKSYVDVGFSGLAIGRNVWQSDNPLELTKKIKKVIWG